jgi:hypothetical protein
MNRIIEDNWFFWLLRGVVFLGFLLLALSAIAGPAKASRESCECRELRAIRVLLQHQLGIACDERRCLPVPTPTVPDGGDLP